MGSRCLHEGTSLRAQVSGSRPRLPGSAPHLGVQVGEHVDGQMDGQRRMGTWPKALATPR